MRKPHSRERIDRGLGFADPPPKADLFIGAGSHDVLAVRRESGDELFAGGLAKGIEALPAGHLPKLHGRITAGTGEHGAVRAKGNAMHGAVVPLECTQ